MIKIDNLKKSFGDFCAVDGITFSVSQGEVLGFLGPNGAGKSTTMKMLTGFIKPSAGTVSVFGHDIEQNPLQAKRIIGYLPEGAPGLWRHDGQPVSGLYCRGAGFFRRCSQKPCQKGRQATGLAICPASAGG